MMCIIIDHGCSPERSFVLKAALGSFVFGKAGLNRLCRNLKERSQCEGSQCIGDIVFSDNVQLVMRSRHPGFYHRKFPAAKFIIRNVCRGKVSRSIVDGIRQHAAGKPVCDFLIIVNVRINDQCSVCRKKFRKTAETVSYVGKIVEEVKVFCFYI